MGSALWRSKESEYIASWSLDTGLTEELLEQFLPDKNDATPLTDPNFIGAVLTKLPKELVQSVGASTGWRALGTKVEVLR